MVSLQIELTLSLLWFCGLFNTGKNYNANESRTHVGILNYGPGGIPARRNIRIQNIRDIKTWLRLYPPYTNQIYTSKNYCS